MYNVNFFTSLYFNFYMDKIANHLLYGFSFRDLLRLPLAQGCIAHILVQDFQCLY